jgi:hypothetical protein
LVPPPFQQRGLCNRHGRGPRGTLRARARTAF